MRLNGAEGYQREEQIDDMNCTESNLGESGQEATLPCEVLACRSSQFCETVPQNSAASLELSGLYNKECNYCHRIGVMTFALSKL